MPIAALLVLLLPQDAPIHGTLRAEGSLEPIPYATVRIPELGRGAVADEHGYYVLPDAPAGEWTVRAQALGYRPAEREVTVSSGASSIELSFELSPRPIELSAIEVTTDREDGNARGPPGPGTVRIDPRTIDVVPALVEADVLRAAQLLPAVQQTSDFSSALYIRGGAPDQSLVTLDGAPLFNPYHLGGVFSAIDPDAVASMDLLPGAFPARIGDRLSGHVDIWTRDGGRDRVRGRGAIGLVSARGSVDGPLPGGDGSYLVSVRRTYLDLLSRATEAVGLTDTSLPYGFTDAHLKLTHDVGELGRLSASFYTNSEELRRLEEFGGSGRDRFAWGSRTGSLSYRQPLGGSLLGELRLAYGDFGTQVRFFDHAFTPAGPGELEELAHVDAFVRDLVASGHVTWHGLAHRVRAGLQLDAYRFDYEARRSEEHSFADIFPAFGRGDQLNTLAAYLEDDWAATDALRLRLGVRGLHAAGVGTELMPRLGVEYALSPRLSLSAGAGRYAQAIHGFRNEEALLARFLSYDLLAPVPERLGLQTATDAVLGAEWESGRTGVRIDGYAKRLDNLVLPTFPTEPNEAPLLVVEDYRAGKGTSYGLELLARHERESGLGIRASYGLSFTEHELEGEEYPPGFSRRHTLDLLGSWPWDQRGQLSARLVLKTGQPYTPVVGAARPFEHGASEGRFVEDRFSPIYLLGDPNAERLPFYWRADIAARKSYDVEWFGRDVTLTPYVQILNVFNVKNVLLPNPPSGSRGFGAPRIEYTPQVPILPTFGIEWTF